MKGFSITRWRERRARVRTARVLRALATSSPMDRREVGEATDLGARAYPILAAMEYGHLVTSQWAPAPPGTGPNWPRRRLYRLTELGARWAAERRLEDRT